MKRNRKGSKGVEQIHLWSYPQAVAAASYIGSVLRSLREYRLDALQLDRKARRLADKPGRPDRSAILAQEEAARAARQAHDRYQEALLELHALDVFCIDPINGLARIPFSHDEQLAWFIFDLFDEEPLRFWRFHEDPLETRRPVEQLLEGPTGTVTV